MFGNQRDYDFLNNSVYISDYQKSRMTQRIASIHQFPSLPAWSWRTINWGFLGGVLFSLATWCAIIFIVAPSIASTASSLFKTIGG
jgi:hypothetical protein